MWSRHTETTRAKSPESWGWAIQHPDPPIPKWYIPQFAHKFVQYKWYRRNLLIVPSVIVIVIIFFPRLAFALGVCGLDVIRQFWGTRKHRKRIVKPLAKGLAPLLGITWQSYLKWLFVPIDLDDDDANISIDLPVQWQGATEQTTAITAMINRRLPGQWEANWRHAIYTVELNHPPPPPDSYTYNPALIDRDGFIPIAIGSRAKEYIIDLDGKTPHVGVFASTGWGKTVTIKGIVARARKQGAIIQICDPKRIGYLCFKGVPGITIHTGIDRMLNAIQEFYNEVERRYEVMEELLGKEIVESGLIPDDFSLDPNEYPRQVLVLDEMGTLVTDGKMKWKNDGNTSGTPTFIQNHSRNLWLGRAAKMHVIVGAHEASAEVLISNDLRNQFGMMIAAGPTSLGAWRKMFGNEPKMKTRSKKGAAIIGIGDELTRVQLQYITDEMARSEALSASNVQPDTPNPSPPGDMPASVHGHNGNGSLIVGIKAGAEFLKMTPAAFTKARQREPGGILYGEQREGRSPAWTRDALVSWHSLRVRAGERDIPGKVE
jgi:hypothetical protein